MTILDQIIENKRYEVEKAKSLVPIESLMESQCFNRKGNSLFKILNSEFGIQNSGIISEFKRKSPSKGNINIGAGVAEVTSGYAQAGASGLSVLTDTNFFGGFKEDLQIAREKNPTTPILRKDFMIDEYQVYEAKAWGADLILLIAANLKPIEIEKLSQKAHELGLEVLLEIHDREELERSPLENVDIVGVNNRNLKNFAENNVNASLELADLIPADKVKISESCIDSADTIKLLKSVGYRGFLIGETFMKTSNPPAKLAELIAEL